MEMKIEANHRQSRVPGSLGLFTAIISSATCCNYYVIKEGILEPCLVLSTCLIALVVVAVIKEGTLEPCHLHLVLSTCLIALVVVVVNITKSKNIIVGHVDNTNNALCFAQPHHLPSPMHCFAQPHHLPSPMHCFAQPHHLPSPIHCFAISLHQCIVLPSPFTNNALCFAQPHHLPSPMHCFPTISLHQ